MAEELQVKGKVEAGVILLTIDYSLELLREMEAHQKLSKTVTDCYREIREQAKGKIKTNSCIVTIQPEVVGSPLVRALFELWREVAEKGSGHVICVDYPQDYIDSLTALGLSSLPRFSLAITEEEAMQKLTRE